MTCKKSKTRQHVMYLSYFGCPVPVYLFDGRYRPAGVPKGRSGYVISNKRTGTLEIWLNKRSSCTCWWRSFAAQTLRMLFLSSQEIQRELSKPEIDSIVDSLDFVFNDFLLGNSELLNNWNSLTDKKIRDIHLLGFTHKFYIQAKPPVKIKSKAIGLTIAPSENCLVLRSWANPKFDLRMTKVIVAHEIIHMLCHMAFSNNPLTLKKEELIANTLAYCLAELFRSNSELLSIWGQDLSEGE